MSERRDPLTIKRLADDERPAKRGTRLTVKPSDTPEPAANRDAVRPVTHTAEPV